MLLKLSKHFFLPFVIVFFCPLVAAQIGVDSLLTRLSSVDNDAVYIETLLEISEAYENEGLVDSAVIYASRATQRASTAGLRLSEAKASYALGYYQDISGQLKDAISNYDKARQIYEELDIKEEVATCLNSKGVASYFQGDFDLALGFYLDALDYVTLHELEGKQADVLNNIGVIYRITGKYRESIDIYKQSLGLYKEQNDSTLVGTAYQNLGVAFNFLEEGPLSVVYLDSAYAIYSRLKDNEELAKIYGAYAETYYASMKDFDQSRRYLMQAEEILVNGTEEEFLAKIYLLWGQVERDDRRPKDAIVKLNEGLSIIKGGERSDMLMNYYDEMSKTYIQLGDDTNALKYQSLYIEAYKDIQSSERLSTIEELQTKYQTVEKENEILKLNADNQLSQQRLESSRRLLFLALLAVALVSGLLYKLYQGHVKLKRADADKDILLKEIHHRVKNNLQVISSLLSLQSRYIRDDKALDALKQGQDRVASMALIHQDLYQQNNLKGVSTKVYLEELVDNLFESYNSHDGKIELITDIDESILDVDTMVPLGLVVNELISNALKHAFAAAEEGVITIIYKDLKDTLFLSVGDNGKGVEDFMEASKSSFGYSLVESFAQKLGAKIDVQSKQGVVISLNITSFKRAD